MSVSTEQLDAFHRFAAEKLQSGAGDISLEDLLRMWRIETEQGETARAIQEGIADIEAGRCHTLQEVDAEIRRRFELIQQTVTKESP